MRVAILAAVTLIGTLALAAERKAPVDETKLPPEKMSVLQLRREVTRLRGDVGEELERLRAENERLRAEVDRLTERLQVAGLATRPASWSNGGPVPRIMSSNVQVFSTFGLRVGDIRVDRQDKSFRVDGIVENTGSQDLKDVCLLVQMVSYDTDKAVSSVEHRLHTPLPAGQKKRFDMYVDYFPRTRMIITAYPGN